MISHDFPMVFPWFSEVQDQEAQEAQRLRELRSREAMEQEVEIQRKRRERPGRAWGWDHGVGIIVMLDIIV